MFWHKQAPDNYFSLSLEEKSKVLEELWEINSRRTMWIFGTGIFLFFAFYTVMLSALTGW